MFGRESLSDIDVIFDLRNDLYANIFTQKSIYQTFFLWRSKQPVEVVHPELDLQLPWN